MIEVETITKVCGLHCTQQLVGVNGSEDAPLSAQGGQMITGSEQGGGPHPVARLGTCRVP